MILTYSHCLVNINIIIIVILIFLLVIENLQELIQLGKGAKI